ncbi:MAG TPA: hypothetical protein VKV15_11965 [Bryobacteraceae bacterium]|nr:hypothetical protein [Bryobacteraceae bacterium]
MFFIFSHFVLLSAAAGSIGPWQSPAHLHRLLKAISGTLILDAEGIEFRSAQVSHRWPYPEIHTFDLVGPKELILMDYENRPWHEPGERRFHLTLQNSIPADLASMVAAAVGKPSRNGDPGHDTPFFAEIPAHHRAWTGGSNGVLRLRQTGIDYITPGGRDGRSWRWSDIQTIANPNPYSLRVTGYREIFEFELKQPLSPALFDWIWDRLYAHGRSISPAIGGGRP